MKIQFLRRITAITSLGSAKVLFAELLILIAAVSGNPANAQCPAVGADTECGVVITVTNTGATISRTGQPPYDNIEDTLVGVINNSNRPISALGLRSSLAIFGFDGDGLCNVQPRPAGCPFGPTGYEGPGVSFSAISADRTSGTVNFSVPVSSGGGTAYFSLEEDISAGCSCADVVNNSVMRSPGGATVTTITATFTPQCGGTGGNPPTLQQAAFYCGFVNFDWQQRITSWPSPSPLFQIGNPVALTAPPSFLDPPPRGYTYQAPGGDNSFPFYYDAFSGELISHETPFVLSFSDTPSDPCLPGGSGAGCGGRTAPAGSLLGFTTHLAGVNSDGTATDLGVGFTWTSTFNGTSGGVATTKNNRPVDPGSGTGGITITSEQNGTSYQYNGIVVTTVNGVPGDTTPPLITVSAHPSILWPPNGRMVPVTVSGTVTDNEPGGTGVNPSTAVYRVTDEYGHVQPNGSVPLHPNGSYSLVIHLQASRAGNDPDGRHYIIAVDAQDNAGNPGSAATGVTVPHDHGH